MFDPDGNLTIPLCWWVNIDGKDVIENNEPWLVQTKEVDTEPIKKNPWFLVRFDNGAARWNRSWWGDPAPNGRRIKVSQVVFIRQEDDGLERPFTQNDSITTCHAAPDDPNDPDSWYWDHERVKWLAYTEDERAALPGWMKPNYTRK